MLTSLQTSWHTMEIAPKKIGGGHSLHRAHSNACVCVSKQGIQFQCASDPKRKNRPRTCAAKPGIKFQRVYLRNPTQRVSACTRRKCLHLRELRQALWRSRARKWGEAKVATPSSHKWEHGLRKEMRGVLNSIAEAEDNIHSTMNSTTPKFRRKGTSPITNEARKSSAPES